MRLRQGKGMAQHYFLEFENLAWMAGYIKDGYDQFLIELIEQGVAPHFVKQVYYSGAVLTTWSEYRTKVENFEACRLWLNN